MPSAGVTTNRSRSARIRSNSDAECPRMILVQNGQSSSAWRTIWRGSQAIGGTTRMSDAQTFRAARDQLLAVGADYDRAYAEFVWTELDAFNWALDWFDEMARDNDNPGLWIVEEDGSELRLSF